VGKMGRIFIDGPNKILRVSILDFLLENSKPHEDSCSWEPGTL